MPWDFGAGVAAAAGAGAGLIGDSIKRERDLQGAADLEALKQKIEQDKQARVAAVLASVSRTKDVPIAGPTVDGSSLGVESQPKPEGEYRRERGDALSKAGLIDYSEKEYSAADRHEENMLNRTTQAAKQKSDDEKWHAQFEQQAAYNKAHLAMQGAQLGLKAQEKKDFDAAADAYSTYKAQYDTLTAQKADPDSIRSIKSAMDRAALSLKQYRVDVSEVAPGAKLGQLNSMMNSVTSTLKDPMLSDADRSKYENTRELIRRAIDAEMEGRGAAGGNGMSDPYADAKAALATGKITLAEVNKRLASKGFAPLLTDGSSSKPTKPAATTAATPAKPYVPLTPEETRLSMQGGATAADRIGGIIDSVKDIRKKTGADKY